MAKAVLQLHNGTNVTIEGTPEEINKLLSFYGALPDNSTKSKSEVSGTKSGKVRSPEKVDDQEELDITAIVNSVKNSDDLDSIEKRILDRTSIVDRTLLPLYIVHEQFGNKFGLTSGEISRVTVELGIPIATPNIAHILAGSASRYVMGNRERKKGVPVHYKISRKGLLYIKSVIAGNNNDK